MAFRSEPHRRAVRRRARRVDVAVGRLRQAAPDERLAAGRTAGYEIVANGFALSGPKYYTLFRETSL